MDDGKPFLDVLIICAQAIWFMLPSIMCNPFAVLFGGGTPIDGGRKDGKGRRVLGDGKTWSGLGWGVLGGVFIGSILVQIRRFGGDAIGFLTDFTPEGATLLGFIGPLLALCMGAMIGDLASSFGKRRASMERGAKAPIIDQLDFVAGSWVFVLIFFPQWTLGTFSGWHALAAMVLIPGMHLSTNWIAWKLGRKNEPW